MSRTGQAGDSALLRDLSLAAPHLGRLPFVTPFLLAVHAVLNGVDETGDTGSDAPPAPDIDITALMRSTVGQGSDTQRTAGAGRLRRLARRLPAHALHQLADILTVTPTASDQ